MAVARRLGLATILASAYEVNAASVHILCNLGFHQTATQPGAFVRCWFSS
jgi:hypothetical protein